MWISMTARTAHVPIFIQLSLLSKEVLFTYARLNAASY